MKGESNVGDSGESTLHPAHSSINTSVAWYTCSSGHCCQGHKIFVLSLHETNESLHTAEYTYAYFLSAPVAFCHQWNTNI